MGDGSETRFSCAFSRTRSFRSCMSEEMGASWKSRGRGSSEIERNVCLCLSINVPIVYWLAGLNRSTTMMIWGHASIVIHVWARDEGLMTTIDQTTQSMSCAICRGQFCSLTAGLHKTGPGAELHFDVLCCMIVYLGTHYVTCSLYSLNQTLDRTS